MPRMTQIQGDWSENESECREVVLAVRSASQGNRTFLGYCCYHWHYGAVTDADSLSAI